MLNLLFAKIQESIFLCSPKTSKIIDHRKPYFCSPVNLLLTKNQEANFLTSQVASATNNQAARIRGSPNCFDCVSIRQCLFGEKRGMSGRLVRVSCFLIYLFFSHQSYITWLVHRFSQIHFFL